MLSFKIIKPCMTVGHYRPLETDAIPETISKIASAAFASMSLGETKTVFNDDATQCAMLKREGDGTPSYLGTVVYYQEIKS